MLPEVAVIITLSVGAVALIVTSPVLALIGAFVGSLDVQVALMVFVVPFAKVPVAVI
jgi:hypothetical protein